MKRVRAGAKMVMWGMLACATVGTGPRPSGPGGGSGGPVGSDGPGGAKASVEPVGTGEAELRAALRLGLSMAERAGGAERAEHASAGEFLLRVESAAAGAGESEIAARAAFEAGVNLALSDRFEEARGAFSRAELLAGEAGVRAACRFNIGAAWFRAATRPAGAGAATDPATNPAAGGRPQAQETQRPAEEVIGLLRRSAEAYREALRLDPGDREAAERVERVRRMIRELEDQQRQSEEMTQQLEGLAERQEQEAQRNQSESAGDGAGAQQRQQGLSEETERQQASAANQGDTPPGVAEALERARREQQEAERRLERGETGAASEAQQRAAEAIREAAEGLKGEQQEPGDQGEPSDAQRAGETPPEGTPTEETKADEASRLADQLLEREERLREVRPALRPSRLGRPGAVEKDW